jgi:hypothetical protein
VSPEDVRSGLGVVSADFGESEGESGSGIVMVRVLPACLTVGAATLGWDFC